MLVDKSYMTPYQEGQIGLRERDLGKGREETYRRGLENLFYKSLGKGATDQQKLYGAQLAPAVGLLTGGMVPPSYTDVSKRAMEEEKYGGRKILLEGAHGMFSSHFPFAHPGIFAQRTLGRIGKKKFAGTGKFRQVLTQFEEEASIARESYSLEDILEMIDGGNIILRNGKKVKLKESEKEI